MALPLMVALLSAGSALSQDFADHLVISEVSGGGGNPDAPYNSDYIELYNPTSADISINDWSVQYSPADGTSWSATPLTGTVKSKGYFLIKLYTGNGLADLPHFDLQGGTSIASLRGKVVLVNTTTPVEGANPEGAHIIDKVGWGQTGTAATGFEGMPAPTSNTTSVLERKAFATSTAESMGPNGEDVNQGNGYDSNNNNQDFVITGTPSPQYSGSPTESPTVASAGEELAGAGLPKSFVLSAVFPNPVQAEGTIKFGLPKASAVQFMLYSAAGAKVQEKKLGTFAAGYHEVKAFSVTENKLAPGAYILRLTSNSGTVSERVVITR